MNGIEHNPYFQLALFILAGKIGVFAHYIHDWARSNYAYDFWHYITKHHGRRNLLTILTCMVVETGMFLSGTLETLSINQVILLGFTTGYSFESSMNGKKGDKDGES